MKGEKLLMSHQAKPKICSDIVVATGSHYWLLSLLILYTQVFVPPLRFFQFCGLILVVKSDLTKSTFVH